MSKLSWGKTEFSLQVNESSSRYKAVTKDMIKLKTKKKLKARQEHPEKFVPDMAVTFPGLSKLPVHLRNETITLSGNDVQSRGKAIGIPLSSNWWVNIELALHGHLVIISSKELKTIAEKRTIQLALINKNPSQPLLIVVHRNRLVTLKFVYTATIFDLPSVWWSENQGACLITEPNIFAHNFDKFSLSNTSKASIFQVLMKR